MKKTTVQYELVRSTAGGDVGYLLGRFVEGLNAGDFVKHNDPQLARMSEEGLAALNRTRWVNYLSTVYNDGRVTTRRAQYVFARKEQAMPEGCCAVVYCETANAGTLVAGYLKRKA